MYRHDSDPPRAILKRILNNSEFCYDIVLYTRYNTIPIAYLTYVWISYTLNT